MVQKKCRQASRSSHRSQSWWDDSGRKDAQGTRLPDFQKNMGFRIIPESYPIHASSFPSLNHGTFAKSRLVFCQHLFLRNYSPCSSSVQQHPSLAPLQQELGTLRTLQHPQASPVQQDQQASPTAPSRSTFHRHPLTSMPAPKHGAKHTPL